MACCEKRRKTADVEETESRQGDKIENSKHNRFQKRDISDEKTVKLPDNWKIVPLLVDKISFLVFLGLQVYFYFFCIPH